MKEEKTAEYYIELGIEKYNNDDFKGAIEDLSKGIEIDPNDMNAYVFRCSCKQSLGDYQGAIEDCNIVSENSPNWQTFYICGCCKNELNDFQGAIKEFDKSLNTTRTNVQEEYSYEQRGKAKINLKSYPEAIVDLTKAIEINPDNMGAYQSRAVAKVNIMDYQGAIKDFTKLIEYMPDYAYAYQERGKCRNELKDFQGAIEDYNKLIELSPNDKDSYQLRGEANLNLHNYESAILDFDRVIEIDSRHEWCYNKRGLAKLHLKKFEEALEDFNAAIDNGTEWIDIYYNTGRAKHGLKDYDSATKDYEKAIIKFTGNKNYYYNLVLAKNKKEPYLNNLELINGVLNINNDLLYSTLLISSLESYIEANEHQSDRLIDACSMIIALDPYNFKAYKERGAEKTSKFINEALIDLNKSIELNNEFAEGYNARSVIKSKLYDFKGALEDACKAVELDTTNMSYLNNRSEIKALLNDYKGALKDVNTVIEFDSNNACYYFNRANTLVQLEDYEGALKDYDTAIKIDYENIDFINSKSHLIKLMGGAEEQNVIILKSKQALSVFDKKLLDVIKEENDFIYLNGLELKIGYSLDTSDMIGGVFGETEEDCNKIINLFEVTIKKLTPWVYPFEFIYFYYGDEYSACMWKFDGKKLLTASKWLGDLLGPYDEADYENEEQYEEAQNELVDSLYSTICSGDPDDEVRDGLVKFLEEVNT